MSLLLILGLLAMPSAQNGGEDPAAAAKAEYEALRQEFWQTSEKLQEPATADGREGYWIALREQRDQYAHRFLALARKHAASPVAVQTLLWMVEVFPTTSDADTAVELVITQHLRDTQLPSEIRNMGTTPFSVKKKLLRLCIEKSDDRTVQGNTWFSLARVTNDESMLARRLATGIEPNQLETLEHWLGKDVIAALKTAEPDAIARQAHAMFERVATEFGDLQTLHSTLGDMARSELFEMDHLVPGKPAPEIEGEDIEGKPMKLSDYRGKVVLLDFWGHW
jgi:hypothetical protein